MKNPLTLFFIALCFSTQAFFSEIDQGTKSDLLVVIDNSGSMGTHRNVIAKRIPLILEKFRDHNLRIGLITTDQNNQKFYIGSNIRGNFETLKSALIADVLATGTNGSAAEEHLQQVLNSFDEENSLFHRKDAHFNVLIITDEDDSYHSPDVTLFNLQLKKLKQGNDISFDLLAPLTGCSQWWNQLNDILLMKVAKSFNGKVYDICRMEK